MARFSSVLVLMLVVPLLVSLTLARTPAHKILSPAESPVPAAPPKTHSHSSPSESPVEAPAMSPSSVSSGSPSEAPAPAVSSANLNRLSIAGSFAVVVMAVALVI